MTWYTFHDHTGGTLFATITGTFLHDHRQLKRKLLQEQAWLIKEGARLGVEPVYDAEGWLTG